MVDSPNHSRANLQDSQTMLDEFIQITGKAEDYPKTHFKILVTGPYQSGKTSFIKGLDTEAICMDKQNQRTSPTTVGFDFASFYWSKSEEGMELIPKRCLSQTDLDYGSHIPIRVYGMPGLKHFSTVRKILSKRSDGVILVLDSTNPYHLAEFEQYYKEVRREIDPKTPILVIANKQDLPNAISTTDIQKELGVNFPVISVSATSGKGVNEAFNMIMDLIRHSKGKVRKVLF